MMISIHALLAESDRHKKIQNARACLFLSTLSLRRATFGTLLKCLRKRFLSTLSLRRATANSRAEQQEQHISIHALLAESDAETAHKRANRLPFLSTLSLRRATARRVLGFVDPDISIHALLAESDK